MEATGASGENFGGHALGHERLNDVMLLNVAEVLERDAAFHTALHLAHVVPKAAQRADLAGIDDHVVTQQPNFAVACDGTVLNDASGDIADFGDTESFADFGFTAVDFLVHRLQQARHGALNFVGQVVDNGVQPDIDLFLLGERGGVSFRTHVEPDDDGVGSGCQQYVGFVDGPYAGVQHANLDLVVREFLKRVGEHFGGTAHVGLEDDGKFFNLPRSQPFLQLLQGQAAALGHGGFADLGFTEQDNLLRFAGIRNDLEVVAGFRQRFQSKDLHRGGGLRIANLFPT